MTTETQPAALEGAGGVVVPNAPVTNVQVQPVTPSEPAKPVVPNLDTPVETTVAVTYDPTGDPALDVALEFIGNLGIDGNHPAMVAAQKGDFSILEAFLATNPDAKGYEKHLQLGKDAFSRREVAAQETATQVLAAVHEVAGGEAEWATIQTWASQNAEPAEKAALNAMFEAGPIQARAAALLLSTLYQGAAGTIIEPASAAKPNSARPANPSAGEPITEKQYAGELQKLRREYGGRMEQSPAYAALQARMSASLKR